jgi:hypothetical protein
LKLLLLCPGLWPRLNNEHKQASHIVFLNSSYLICLLICIAVVIYALNIRCT